MNRVIRIVDVVGRVTDPQGDPVGSFIRDMDFDAQGGLGEADLTSDPQRAKQFVDAREALHYFNTRSKVRPIRDDGKPNCPLHAFVIEVVSLQRAMADLS